MRLYILHYIYIVNAQPLGCEKRRRKMLVKTQSTDHELVMPKRYTELSKEEMEYDGGWLNFLVAGVALVVGATASVLSAAGVISPTTALVVNIICVGVATVASGGIVGIAGASIKNGITTMATAGSNAAKASLGATEFLCATTNATSGTVNVAKAAVK
jgi:hypothetical protein